MIRGVLISFLIAVSSPILAQGQDLEAAFKKGEAAWRQGDIVNAMMILKPVADAGHAKAQAIFGLALDQADNDVEAGEYYRKAADQNDPDGAYGLAGLFLTGDAGTKDLKKAHDLYEKAAGLEHVQSIIALAVGYQQDDWGFGEDAKNSAAAWKWIERSAALNHLDSMVRLEGAYRSGNPHVKQNIAAADELKARIIKAQGLEEVQQKKRRRSR